MYAGNDYRDSDYLREGGQLAGYGVAVLPLVSGALSVLSSLNPFSSGPDKDKWNARAKRVSQNIQKAQAGDIRAWYALGAFGLPSVPLPMPLDPPYVGEHRSAGFTVEEMGKDYNPLRRQAADAYNALKPMFLKTGGGDFSPVTSVTPISLPGMPGTPGVPPVSSAPIPFPSQPSPSFPVFPDPGNNLPVYQPDPTQGVIPSPMQPQQEASIFGIPKNLAMLGLVIGVGSLVLPRLLDSGARRNPPRRRRATRRRRR